VADLIPVTATEIRRLVPAMAEHEGDGALRFGWAVWRQVHEAVAARCAVARRTRAGNHPRPPKRASPPELPQAGLTDAEWEAVRSLLPPPRPPIGRPRHDHRRVLGGILWVVRTGASWRDLPPDCGKWETASKRSASGHS
jgi:hypothetical protein